VNRHAAIWLLMGVLVAIFVPCTAGSAEFRSWTTLTELTELRGDTTITKPRPKIIAQIYRHAMTRFNVSHEEAVQFAEAISRRPHPRLLAGVCSQEGQFNPRANITWGGCRGAYQVSPGDWGPIPHDIAGQTEQASMVLELMLKKYKGNVVLALRAYNGSPWSEATAPYPKKVLRWCRKLDAA